MYIVHAFTCMYVHACTPCMYVYSTSLILVTFILGSVTPNLTANIHINEHTYYMYTCIYIQQAIIVVLYSQITFLILWSRQQLCSHLHIHVVYTSCSNFDPITNHNTSIYTLCFYSKVHLDSYTPLASVEEAIGPLQTNTIT